MVNLYSRETGQHITLALPRVGAYFEIRLLDIEGLKLGKLVTLLLIYPLFSPCLIFSSKTIQGKRLASAVLAV